MARENCFMASLNFVNLTELIIHQRPVGNMAKSAMFNLFRPHNLVMVQQGWSKAEGRNSSAKIISALAFKGTPMLSFRERNFFVVISIGSIS